ncbi:MAG TPA: efflux RND transporter permease subunit [Candidatus Binatia bacterium]|jgi:multidrug efflux pump|nr:efflux RND transporter permease subunit [Candidatus Binatia bacterium]
MSRFFVDRPIFATVISVVIIIIGGVALFALPVAQYPEVTPPVVQVAALYPGANAKVVADTVAAPLEQEINGVENMLYMLSKSTNDGQLYLDVTFKLGTDIDEAQVLTQNRVSIAEAKLPEEVKRQGVTAKKKSPSILLAVNLISPDDSRDALYLSNYATIQVKDALARLAGVGDVGLLGARDYSMRVWLDPERLASRNLTANDAVSALREQNVQVAAGRIGQPPVPAGVNFQYTINTLGRLLDPEQFAEIIIKTGEEGQVTRLRDVARVELGAKNSDVNSYLDGKPAITLAVFQLPGSNALATAEGVKAEMERLKERFPVGVDYRIVYDTTVFVNESVHEVYKTLYEAFILVFIVVLVFLQDWRATLMPMIDVPVSLIGTFAVMAVMGFSLNNLSLFGLVLAIGIVVDDAIVVVENVERWMAKGYTPREATIKAMDEITGPVIAITLVLSSVFVPTAFIAGISGQFYRQFALTVAVSTIISALNALTMAPARAPQLLKPHGGDHQAGEREALPRLAIILIAGLLVYLWGTPPVASWLGTILPAPGHPGGAEPAINPLALWGLRFVTFGAGCLVGWGLSPLVNRLLGRFFQAFNHFFDRATSVYGRTVRGLLRLSVIMLLLYGGLLGLTYLGFNTVPVGFIPEQDKGYLVVNAQLPDGASLERTEEVMTRVTEIARNTPGVAHTISLPGYSILTSNNIANAGGMFIILAPFEERVEHGLQASKVLAALRARLRQIQEAQVVAFGAPPVEGLGSTGGFKLHIQDRGDLGPQSLQATVENILEKGNVQPGLVGLFSSFRANQPQLYVDVNRTQAKTLGVSLDDVFDTLQVYLGSAYANDFTRFGRNWQVNVQADASFRIHPEDIGKLKVRNAAGAMVPLATLVSVQDTTGPAIVNRYNMFPSAEITGGMAPGVSSGQAIALMEQIAEQELPAAMSFAWTELTLLQILAGNTAPLVFALGTLFVFMVLAAQYESWTLPVAIILIVPMCLLAAIGGVWFRGMENNIFTQIGLVVLIGLAAKNAILVVEFAKVRQDEGLNRFEAAVEASQVRLRPILMTSFAFALGVLPLVLGQGAGAEMRQSLGVAVFFGMLGVTAFGLLFTPVFYVVIQGLSERRAAAPAPGAAQELPPVHVATASGD